MSSVHYSLSKNIAFLGPKGSYSHLAAKKYADKNCPTKTTTLSCQKFIDIIQLVNNKNIEYGILPIENSTSGPIYEVCDLLQKTCPNLIGEVSIPVEHYLLTNSNILIDNIKEIYSHNQSFQQCSNFLKNFPKLKIINCLSTSEAAKIVAKINIPTVAALGDKGCGLLYGLQTKKLNLFNKRKNITRFIVISNKNKDNSIFINKLTKTTLITISQKKSTIFINKLMSLKQYGIKITNLITRPIPNNNHEKFFLIDIQANMQCKRIQSFLNKSCNKIQPFKILGCYPSKKKF